MTEQPAEKVVPFKVIERDDAVLSESEYNASIAAVQFIRRMLDQLEGRLTAARYGEAEDASDEW